jgi:hypothetical protein
MALDINIRTMRYNEFRPQHTRSRVREDIKSAEALPLRYYDGIYAEPGPEGSITVYGVDQPIEDEDRGGGGWFDFSADTVTGRVRILDTRSRWEGGDMDLDTCREAAEEILADVLQAYGRTWAELDAELRGSWGVDESLAQDHSLLSDLAPPVLAAARDRIAALAGDFKRGSSRMVLQREQADRLAAQLSRIPLDQLSQDRPVEDLPRIIYHYWYRHILQGHPMGGTKSHDRELQAFLQDDLAAYLEGDHVEISTGWGVD